MDTDRVYKAPFSPQDIQEIVDYLKMLIAEHVEGFNSFDGETDEEDGSMTVFSEKNAISIIASPDQIAIFYLPEQIEANMEFGIEFKLEELGDDIIPVLKKMGSLWSKSSQETSKT